MRDLLPAPEILALGLRRLSRGPGFAFSRVGYALALAVPAVGAAFVPMTSPSDREVIGHALFLVQAGVAGIAAALVVPVLVVMLVTEEARAGRLPLMVLSGRKAERIVTSLVLGEILAVLSVLLAGVPLGLVTGLLGGVRGMDVLFAVSATVGLAALGGGVGVLLAVTGRAGATGLAVGTTVAAALLMAAGTWRLHRAMGLPALPVGGLVCLGTAGVLLRVASRRLDAVAFHRGGRRAATPEDAPVSQQTRSVPELWPLIEPGVRLAEEAWVVAGLVTAALACTAALAVRVLSPATDGRFAENLMGSVGAVLLGVGLMLATWYPALRVASLVEPRSLGMVAATTQDPRRVLGQMETAAAELAGGTAVTGILLLVPSSIRQGGGLMALMGSVTLTVVLLGGLLSAAILVGVDAPNPRRALGSATLLWVLGMSVAGVVWGKLLSGDGVSTEIGLLLAAVIAFLASLARSQARHMFRGRWREPLGDLWRLRVW